MVRLDDSKSLIIAKSSKNSTKISNFMENEDSCDDLDSYDRIIMYEVSQASSDDLKIQMIIMEQDRYYSGTSQTLKGSPYSYSYPIIKMIDRSKKIIDIKKELYNELK